LFLIFFFINSSKYTLIKLKINNHISGVTEKKHLAIR